MIAALYVETDGVYYGLPDVDPWDEQRDARLYEGPWPVVAHPPCARWTAIGQWHPTGRGRVGQDDGCFEEALYCVRRFGGVLEHPAHSIAWKRYGLQRPTVGWQTDLLDAGWVCEVDQAAYGHPARKLTWLYLVGQPLELDWSRPYARYCVQNLHGFAASKTPPAFRDVLISLAASSRLSPGEPDAS